MTLKRKILVGTLAVFVAACAAFAVAISYNAGCDASKLVPGGTPVMKAIVYRCYGPPSVLQLEDVARPEPGDDQLLVRVHAAAANPLDWHYMRGEPYVMRLSSGLGRPNETQLGVDFAGTVEAVGRNVTRFKPGDAVFGSRTGAFAEYVVVREDRAVIHKPSNLGFEEAAAVPIAAVTALQAVRDKGRVQAGQRVLVNGASGGVGTYAVQIAKALGAEVTGVSSTRNLALVRSLGADHVIDYTRENFTEGAQRYDVIIDNVGSHSLLAYRKVLEPNGIVVMVGSTSKGAWIGPLARPMSALLLSPFVSQKFEMLLAEFNPADMETLGQLLASGQVRSVIDRRYALAEVPAAIAYLEEGRARGKVVIQVLEDQEAPPAQ
ncbi:MAG: NAD(P)-dependent alcohol dehydrogenase [Steroidobacteraceae bacterium]|jgi:NADPH:quinone reductase-like Zn-dependent oxidoreductase|nr:NAD(P)-dependent alcohol dehydrogenase [Steroidobacteraceae bacterium]